MLGAQCGLKPTELLDMTNSTLQAYLYGRQNALSDQLMLAVQAGYWSGYYQSKNPKPVNQIISKIEASKHGVKVNPVMDHSDDAPDVEHFLELEKKRLGGEC